MGFKLSKSTLLRSITLIVLAFLCFLLLYTLSTNTQIGGNKTVKITSSSPESKPLTFQFASHDPDLKITPTKTNIQPVFKRYLDSLITTDIHSSSFYAQTIPELNPKSDVLTDIKTIQFNFYPLPTDQKSIQNYYLQWFMYEDSTLYVISAGTIKGTTFNIPIYINLDLLSQTDTHEEIESFLSNLCIHSLSLNLNLRKPLSTQQLNELTLLYYQKVADNTTPFFRIKESTSCLFNNSLFQKLNIVSVAHAQSCTPSSGITCRRTVSSSVCTGGSKNGSTCKKASECPGGVCDPNNHCQITATNNGCSWNSTYSSCFPTCDASPLAPDPCNSGITCTRYTSNPPSTTAPSQDPTYTCNGACMPNTCNFHGMADGSGTCPSNQHCCTNGSGGTGPPPCSCSYKTNVPSGCTRCNYPLPNPPGYCEGPVANGKGCHYDRDCEGTANGVRCDPYTNPKCRCKLVAAAKCCEGLVSGDVGGWAHCLCPGVCKATFARNPYSVTIGSTRVLEVLPGPGIIKSVTFTIPPLFTNPRYYNLTPTSRTQKPFTTTITGVRDTSSLVNGARLLATIVKNPPTQQACTANTFINVSPQSTPAPTPRPTATPRATATPTPTPILTLSGRVYEGTGTRLIPLSTSACTHSGTLPTTTATGFNVYYNGTRYPVTNGTFGPITLIRNTDLSLELRNLPADYTCTCPPINSSDVCPYTITSPTTNLTRNFYVTQIMPAWYQTVGANIHSSGSLINYVPTTCTNPCLPHTSLRLAGVSNSSGFASFQDAPAPTNGRFGPSPSTFRQTDTFTRIRISNPYLQDQTLRVPEPNPEGYWMLRHYYQVPQDMTSSDNNISSGNQPSSGNSDATPYYYWHGDLTINNPWNVTSGTYITVFVHGNLAVNRPITVAPGGFLAFIVQGNITFSNDLGSADPSSTTPVVEGIYIADGILSVPGSPGDTPDRKFVAAGTFVGHGGITLSRSYKGLDNNTHPSELFIFRPDLIINAPVYSTYFHKNWRLLPP